MNATTYSTKAANTRTRRNAQYAKRREQAKAMRAYSDAMTAWRLGGKTEADKPMINQFWKW